MALLSGTRPPPPIQVPWYSKLLTNHPSRSQPRPCGKPPAGSHSQRSRRTSAARERRAGSVTPSLLRLCWIRVASYIDYAQVHPELALACVAGWVQPLYCCCWAQQGLHVGCSLHGKTPLQPPAAPCSPLDPPVSALTCPGSSAPLSLAPTGRPASDARSSATTARRCSRRAALPAGRSLPLPHIART
jgi:hypothetical protein